MSSSRSATRGRSRKPERFFQSYDLLATFGIHDRDAGYTDRSLLDHHLSRLANEVTHTVERNVDEIIFRVVGDANHWNPFSDDLIAEVERCDFNFGPLAEKRAGDPIEVVLPIRLGKREHVWHGSSLHCDPAGAAGAVGSLEAPLCTIDANSSRVRIVSSWLIQCTLTGPAV